MTFQLAYDGVIVDRRSSLDRRQFHYTVHIPERRMAPDRRTTNKKRSKGMTCRANLPQGTFSLNTFFAFPAVSTN